MAKKVTFIGAEREDQGPKGLIVRFIEAAVDKDENTFRACLTENSREIISVDQMALEGNTITIGDVTAEGELFVMTLTAVDESGSDEMTFVVREENGELCVDMQAAMERLMGMTRDEAIENMAESVAEGMGTTATEMTEEVPAGLQQGQWVLSQEALADFPEQLLMAAVAVGRFSTPEFSPPLQELDTEEYATEESQVKTTRYGDQNHGFNVTETFTSGDGFSSHNLTANAFGMSAGHEISVVWTKYISGDTVTTENVTIQAIASEESLRAVEEFLSEEIGIQ
jgi:hypothetical protein